MKPLETKQNPLPDTLLAVDDNITNLDVMVAILEEAGYNVLSAKSGRTAILLAKKHIPNLILLDIDMPKMNGLQACRFLKQTRSTRDIPVIFVTAMTDNETLQEAFESGGTDYVRKPVNSVELLSRIKSVLDNELLKKSLIEKEKLVGVLEMAGAVCHEFNQPLQAMQLYLDILDAGNFKENKGPEELDRLREQLDRISGICRKIMRISKYESTDYVDGIKIIDIDKASKKT